MTLLHGNRGDRSGAVAAEFALLIPLICIMLFGVFQFGFAIYTYNAMTMTARTGARQIVFGTATATAEAATRSALPAWARQAARISSVANDSGVARVTIRVPGSSAALIRIVPMPSEFKADVTMPRVADR